MVEHIKMSILLFITACLLAGCGLAKRQELQNAYTSAEAAESLCDSKKLSGEYKKWSQVTACYESDVYPIYFNAQYPNIDLIQLVFAQYASIHEKMDAKKISASEGRVLKIQAKSNVNNTIMQRAGAQAQVDSAQAARSAAAASWARNIQDNMNANRTRSCTTFGNNTTCY